MQEEEFGRDTEMCCLYVSFADALNSFQGGGRLLHPDAFQPLRHLYQATEGSTNIYSMRRNQLVAAIRPLLSSNLVIMSVLFMQDLHPCQAYGHVFIWQAQFLQRNALKE